MWSPAPQPHRPRPQQPRPQQAGSGRLDPSPRGGRHAERQHRLVLDHLGLAERMARRYTPGRLDDDTHQVALLGLTLAARRFDPDRGVPFGAFAAPTVMGEIRKHYRSVGWLVRPPRRLQELSRLVRVEERRLEQELGRAPDVAELALATGADVGEVRQARQADLPAGSVDEDATAAIRSEDAADDVVRGVAAAAAVQRLDAVDRRLVGLRYGDGLTQRQIAEALGLSQSTVHRRLREVVEHLRQDVGT